MATMTRAHFEMLAQVIRDGREHYRSNDAHVAHAVETAKALRATNPRFDAARFVKAAMPTAWVGTRHEAAWERAAQTA